MSLIERKKRQWAEERAEMENFCTPWGLPPPAYRLEYSQSRSRYGSTLEIRNTCPPTAQQDLLPRRQRSPSLPPILKYNDEPADNNITEPIKKLVAAGKPNKYGYEDGEGETSGYASESAPQSSPELWQNKQKDFKKPSQDNHHNASQYHLPVPAWQYNDRNSDDSRRNQGVVGSKEESEQRPRWGDRGMAAGRLWEPQQPDARLPQVQTKGTPAWVERSLTTIDNGDTQILLLDQQSNHSSVGDGDYRSENTSDRNTFLLGQNVPIDASLKAERESRRIKAMELQTAIMQQLEERERQRREEKTRRLKEEREEDERYRRQRELEKQRLDEEKMISEEKRKREQKRAEALRQALERAEQQAKLEKENKKNKKMQDNFDNMSINSELNINHDTKEIEKSPQKHLSPRIPPSNSENKTIQNMYIEQAYSPRRDLSPEKNTAHRSNMSLNETNMLMCHPNSAKYNRQTDSFTITSQLNDEHKVDAPRQSSEMNNTFFQTSQPINLLSEAPVSLVQVPMPHELYTPVHFAHGNGVQMAILMPQHINSLYSCMHQPMNMHSSIFTNDGSSHHPKTIYQTQSQTDEESGSTRESKVLTPSKYRNPNSVDVSTQTELELVHQNIAVVEPIIENDRMRNLTNTNTIKDQNNSNNTSEEVLNSITGKKDKRYVSEERFSKDLESRPKWGVNIPPMQYKKQSEKDIFYTQKRKLRQRKRIQEKQYTSHSSDDNRSPSPPRELINKFPTNRLDRNRVSLSENHWRKKNLNSEKIFNSGNVIVETTQISPLECDKSGVVHIRNNVNYQNQKKIYEKKATSGRGMTLSQKFMIDKYGNSKLWPSDCPDNTVLSDIGNSYKKYDNNTQSKEKEKYDNRKHYYDSLNKAKKEQSAYYCDPESSQPIVLDQLRFLRNSLKKQQQIWGKYDKSKRSPSPKNEVDLEID